MKESIAYAALAGVRQGIWNIFLTSFGLGDVLLKTNQLKTPVGLRNGELVRAIDLPKEQKGSACRCVCPHCKQPLVAHLKGIGRVPHFKHLAAAENCGKALESAAHRFAKEVLTRVRHIRLPDVSAGLQVARKEEVFIFDDVLEEQELDGIIPDIVLIGREKVLVEIVVTNSPSEKKLRIVKERDLAVLLIYIDYVMAWEFDPVALEEAIINATDNKEWAHHPYIEVWREAQLLKAEQAKAEAERRKQQRLDAIRKQSCLRYQTVKRSEWESKLRSDTRWLRVSAQLGLELSSLPAYLDVPIEGDFIFECDRRLWQALLFRKLIYYGEKPFVGATFKLKTMVDWVKDWSSILIFSSG